MSETEFDIIRRYFTRQPVKRREVLAGIGDDAAVLQLPSGRELLVCIDTLVAGVHFPEGTPAAAIGHKALAVNLSDLAAMGAECLAWVLYSEVLHLEYSFQWPVWVTAPVAGALLIGAAGYWGTRSVVERSPMLLLHNQ